VLKYDDNLFINNKVIANSIGKNQANFNKLNFKIKVAGKGVTVYRYTNILQYEKINFVPRYNFWKTGIL
jgi:hypothetical protein